MWWDEYPKKFNREVEALRRHCPAAQIVLSGSKFPHSTCCGRSPNHNKHLTVFAQIETRLGKQYPIVMVYPCNFPNRIPSVWPMRKLRPQPPTHQYRDERLCLTNHEANPAITGVMVLTWAYGWLNCYDIWRMTGHFPKRNFGKFAV